MKARRYRKLILRLFILAAASFASLSSARSQATSRPAVGSSLHKVIVVGFVGGFVKHDDARHAEVQFAARLRNRYASGVEVRVFGNHSGQEALRYVLRLLDTNRDGALTAPERGQAKVIIFGHSWGEPRPSS